MEDFYYAGGVPAVVRALGDLIHKDALTVNGKTMGENTADAPCWNAEVIHGARQSDSVSTPASRCCAATWRRAVRWSNLPQRLLSLLKHRGRAVVFTDIEDFKERVDDPALDVDENSVMVLQGAGPKGYPGMPEVGNMPMPKKLLERGITDLVRVSDARMSGTAYGTVVLHVTPESSAGGTLALVQDGDEIELDVEARKLELCVSEEETRPQTRSLDAAATACQGRLSEVCTLNTFCKPIKERIWISWSAAAARICPGRVTKRVLAGSWLLAFRPKRKLVARSQKPELYR